MGVRVESPSCLFNLSTLLTQPSSGLPLHAGEVSNKLSIYRLELEPRGLNIKSDQMYCTRSIRKIRRTRGLHWWQITVRPVVCSHNIELQQISVYSQAILFSFFLFLLVYISSPFDSWWPGSPHHTYAMLRDIVIRGDGVCNDNMGLQAVILNGKYLQVLYSPQFNPNMLALKRKKQKGQNYILNCQLGLVLLQYVSK